MKLAEILRGAAIACAIALNPLASNASAPVWITADGANVVRPNSWITYSRDVSLKKVPKSVVLDIAADTKYWLYVNDSLAVFEGGLKRGAAPDMSYYDSVEIAPLMHKGENNIRVLLWHFGKDGFSHMSSGKAALIVRCPQIEELNSGAGWLSRVEDAYGTMVSPVPNYRLAESNISYDARKARPLGVGLRPSAELGGWGAEPWGALVARPIPQWRDYGVTRVEFVRKSAGEGLDSIIAVLPCNIQITPLFVVNDPKGGRAIGISTDHSFAGGTDNIRAEYITRPGRQEYESFGWMIGERLYLTLPSDVEVEELAYRRTGYDTEVAGTFTCDDDFYTRFWEKAMRTLSVNMRDTWFDCPDRERAQWWGDGVVLMGEAFYTYSHTSHSLMRKAICELCAWQHPDGALSSPIPGNYKHELPAQMLASVGRYGYWNYYMSTGDSTILTEAYPAVKRYLSLWKQDKTGLTALRKGGWNWGDWGDNRDMRLIYAGWHYMALDAAARMADVLGKPDDAAAYRTTMDEVKRGYNRCWNGYAYRHPSYHGSTDDRVQALAVISGIAGEDKYPALFETLKTQEHASPYMEKYVMESLFRMGQGDYAMERTRRRFGPMVDNPDYSTLFEGWGIGKEGYGGGTTNHAWSGGAVTVIGQYLFGVEPVEPGYRLFKIDQRPALFRKGSITVPSVAGDILSGYELADDGTMVMSVGIPAGAQALVYIPADSSEKVTVGGNRPVDKVAVADSSRPVKGKLCYRFPAGRYEIRVAR